MKKTGTINRLRLPLPHGFRFEKIENILFCEAQNNYTNIYLTNGEICLLAKTLKKTEDILPCPPFFRINRKHLVNLQFVKEYNCKDGLRIFLNNGLEFFLSKKRKADFFKLIDKLE